VSIDERLRLNIHTGLSDLLGTAEADALISHIMSVPWQDVASKDDLRVQSLQLSGEIAQVRTELQTEIAQLRTELHTEVAQLRTEVVQVRGDLSSEISSLRAEMHLSFTTQTRWMIGFIVTWSGVLLAAIRFLG